MSNDFYEYTIPVNSGTTIRSNKYNSDQQGIEAGFESVQVETDRSLKFQAGFNNVNLPEVLVESLILADTDGVSLYPMSSFAIAVQSAIDNASSASASASTATTKANEAEVFRNEAEVFRNEAEVFRNEAEVFRDEAEIFTGSTAQNALKLGNELPAFYAKQSDLDALTEQVNRNRVLAFAGVVL